MAKADIDLDLMVGTLTIEVNAEDILDWVRTHFCPEEVFDSRELHEWAAENGYGEDGEL